MAGWFTSQKDCYCAFCKSPRRIYPKKHAGLVDFTLVMLFAVCLSTGLWTWWDPRSIVIFSVGIGTAELFVYLRWRFSIVCTLCGFDPVLYRKSPHLAREKVQRFYETKTQDPQFMLSKSPLVELYRKSLEIKRRNEAVLAIAQKKGTGVPVQSGEMVRRPGSNVDRQV